MTNYRLGMFDENAYAHGMDVVKDMRGATGKVRGDTHFVVVAVYADGYLQFAGADATLNIPIDRLMTKQVAQMILGRMGSHGEIDIEESPAKPAGNEVTLREACAKMLSLLMLRGDGKTHCILSWDEFNDSQKMLRSALAEPSAVNAASVRETLLKCRELVETIWQNEGGEDVSSEIAELKDRIDAALAASPRNCDRKFVDRVDMYYAFKDWCHAKGHTIEPLLASDAFDWFLETATEKGVADDK